MDHIMCRQWIILLAPQRLAYNHQQTLALGFDAYSGNYLWGLGTSSLRGFYGGPSHNEVIRVSDSNPNMSLLSGAILWTQNV